MAIKKIIICIIAIIVFPIIFSCTQQKTNDDGLHKEDGVKNGDSLQQEITNLNQRAEKLEAEAREYEAEAQLWKADAQNEGNTRYQKYADQEFATAKKYREQAQDLRKTAKELATAIMEKRDYITINKQKVYVGMTSDASVKILNPNGMKPYQRFDPTVIQLGNSLSVTHHEQFGGGTIQVDITYERVVDPGPYKIVKIVRRQKID